jgi:hypothetical protein
MLDDRPEIQAFDVVLFQRQLARRSARSLDAVGVTQNAGL